MENFKPVNMDNIMSASFGESSGNIRATFKKTVNIKQYETEVTELSSTLELPGNLTGIERMLISAVLQAQLEYEGYILMRVKGVVTDAQLAARKNELEQDVNLIKSKGEALLNKPLDYIFEIVNKQGNGNGVLGA